MTARNSSEASARFPSCINCLACDSPLSGVVSSIARPTETTHTTSNNDIKLTAEKTARLLALLFNDETGYLDVSELKKYLVTTYELTSNEAEIVINKLQRKKEYEYPTYNSTQGNNNIF